MSANPTEINEAHYKDDLDVSWSAHHHTIGPGATQAAPGNHSHSNGSGGGTGTDEVAIQSGQPANSYDLWIDTDESPPLGPSGPPGGPASGDLTGTYPSPVVNKATSDFVATTLRATKAYNINGVNLNGLTSPGFYDGSGCPGTPAAIVGNWFYLEVYRHSNLGSVYVLQIITALAGVEVQRWMRRCYNNVWEAWFCVSGPAGNPYVTATVNDSFSFTGASYGKGFTWPSGKFTQVPMATCAIVGGVLATAFYCQLRSITATGGTFYVYSNDGQSLSGVTISYNVIGMQSLYNAGEG